MDIAFFIAFLFGFGLIMLFFLLYKKIAKVDTDCYDERQKQGQFVAYRASFWTLFAAVLVNAMIENIYGKWGTPMVSAFACCLVGITVYACICILKDAYTPLNRNPVRYIILFLAVALINLAIGIMNIRYIGLYENGLLTHGFVNLMCAGVLIVIDIVYTIDTIIKRRARTECAEEE